MRRLMLMALMVPGAMGVSLAQTNAAPNAVKLTKYILGVSDLDKSVVFYQALGIELDGKVGQPQPLPDFLLKLVDVPKGTKFRNAMMKIPGADFALELTEFTGMELHPGRPRIQDPGAAILVILVRDADAALASAKKMGTEVLGLVGKPLRAGPKSSYRAVIVRDPDGFYVELNQPDTIPASSAPPASNIVSAWPARLVADADMAGKFYRDSFGAGVTMSTWAEQTEFNKITGTPNAQGRIGELKLSGNTYAWRFLERKDIDRKPYRLRIPDPGAPAIGLEVRDLDAAAAAFKAAGGSVITQGGSIQFPNGDRLAFMRDPSGILVEVAQPAAKHE